jgi:hypothetical protein
MYMYVMYMWLWLRKAQIFVWYEGTLRARVRRAPVQTLGRRTACRPRTSGWLAGLRRVTLREVRVGAHNEA